MTDKRDFKPAFDVKDCLLRQQTTFPVGDVHGP
jgi:hypothetical protein